MFSLLDGAPGLDDEQAQRDFMSDTLKRTVESRGDLTDAEGKAIIARLEAWQRGEPDAAWSPFGGEAA